MTAAKRRRRGTTNARQAKRELRSKMPSAVGPGMVGGYYRPLTDHELQRIHAAALDILERIGLADPIPELVELALARGCNLNAQGRLCFPQAFVEDIIVGAARNFVLYGRDPKHDLEISGNRVHYGTGGAAVSVIDPYDSAIRPSTLQDVYDFARLADQLNNVHWFTRCVIATELSDPLQLDINTAYAIVAGTQKHLGTAITVVENVAPIVALFDHILGGEGSYRQRPFCKLHSSPIVPPLRFGEDACKTLVAAVHHGMPINAITAAQAGATAPATLAGTLVQTTAETLAALILTNLVAPGHPFIFSNWPMVSDLRTGAFSGGGGEEAVLNAASAQIINFYDLPSGVAAGMSDAKIPDAQAGYEKALTNVAAGLAGANLVYESAGMLASLLVASYESFVIDNDMLSAALRTVRGIEVTDETLSLDVIEETVYGPGHFLGSAQTLALMESEYVYPAIGDRLTPEEWVNQGSQDIWAKAKTKAREILADHYPVYIEPERDRKIRDQFEILLDVKVTNKT